MHPDRLCRSCSTCCPHATALLHQTPVSAVVSVGSGENWVRETARLELGKLQDPEKTGKLSQPTTSTIPTSVPHPVHPSTSRRCRGPENRVSAVSCLQCVLYFSHPIRTDLFRSQALCFALAAECPPCPRFEEMPDLGINREPLRQKPKLVLIRPRLRCTFQTLPLLCKPAADR